MALGDRLCTRVVGLMMAILLASKLLWFYLTPLFLIYGVYVCVKVRNHRRNLTLKKEALEAGLTQPASLHPVIDHNLCMGCGTCVAACPESEVLGIINNKSHLINPTHCIGHGLCKKACPQDAITLVFGTAERGVDIPYLNPNFETNIPGIFIAGELGGMGLIYNAIEQGRQAVENIAKLDGIGTGDQIDVVIIGAGPAGFSASLTARELKLRFVTIEQESLGGTVAHYPRGKIVMTNPVKLPVVGKLRFREVKKEELLKVWHEAIERSGIKINYNERVEAIERLDNGFEVKTTRSTYRSRAVLLAIGRRGTPRKLGVKGEELPKVVYRLIDPEQYRGKKVLIVGGGDSALEAALSIAEEPDTSVTLSYRSDAFFRAKEKNRMRIKEAAEAGSIYLLMKSNVKSIEEGYVDIECDGRVIRIENDAVIICAGGILPTKFLEKIGIKMETKYGTP